MKKSKPNKQSKESNKTDTIDTTDLVQKPLVIMEENVEDKQVLRSLGSMRGRANLDPDS